MKKEMKRVCEEDKRLEYIKMGCNDEYKGFKRLMGKWRAEVRKGSGRLGKAVEGNKNTKRGTNERRCD